MPSLPQVIYDSYRNSDLIPIHRPDDNMTMEDFIVQVNFASRKSEGTDALFKFIVNECDGDISFEEIRDRLWSAIDLIEGVICGIQDHDRDSVHKVRGRRS